MNESDFHFGQGHMCSGCPLSDVQHVGCPAIGRRIGFPYQMPVRRTEWERKESSLRLFKEALAAVARREIARIDAV